MIYTEIMRFVEYLRVQIHSYVRMSTFREHCSSFHQSEEQSNTSHYSFLKKK